MKLEDVNLRTCNICSSSDIEDEFHLMCVCPKYSDLRNNLFEAISKFVVNFDTLSLEHFFLILLSSQQSDVNLLVVDYVNKCFEVKSYASGVVTTVTMIELRA